MGSMTSKYDFIMNKLSNIAPVYTVQASSTAKLPYIIVDFTTQNELDCLKDELFLDVDVWHKATSKNDVFMETEDLADKVESCLKYLRDSDSEHGYVINQINRIRVPDEDKTTQHRKLKFYVKAYNRF